jgi:hypothetical protein
MKTETKATKTFSLDQDILAAVKSTKGALSESERVNRLLRYALDLEKRAQLDSEAAEFFGTAPTESRAERRGYEAANARSWSRE